MFHCRGFATQPFAETRNTSQSELLGNRRTAQVSVQQQGLLRFSPGQRTSQVGGDRALAFLRNRAGDQESSSAVGFAGAAANELPDSGTSLHPGSPVCRWQTSRLSGRYEYGKGWTLIEQVAGSRGTMIVANCDVRHGISHAASSLPPPAAGRSRGQSDDGSTPERSDSDLCKASNIWLMFRDSYSHPRSQFFVPRLLPLQVGIQLQASVLAAFCTFIVSVAILPSIGSV